MILVILKLLVVLFFLIMFIRRPTVVWGIGLLTVTSAALLDTLLGTFNREELLAELGFFFYVISGVLLAGAAAWFWGVVRPWLPDSRAAVVPVAPLPVPVASSSAPTPRNAPTEPPAPAPRLPPSLPPDHVDNFAEAGFDRQMLFDEIHRRFSPDDVRDLIFDLDLNEMELTAVGQSMDDLIVRVMDAADRDGKAATVALAVERILTPPHPENLPRLEKITVDSPRTVIRHYLLANYDVAGLVRMANSMDIDWEQLEGSDKKAKTRSFLLYLYRRNRVDALLETMRASSLHQAEE
jgi:hypothetical protein